MWFLSDSHVFYPRRFWRGFFYGFIFWFLGKCVTIKLLDGEGFQAL
jgi:hypothetical protein